MLSKLMGIRLPLCAPALQNLHRLHREIKWNMLYFAAQMFYYTHTSQPQISKKKQCLNYLNCLLKIRNSMYMPTAFWGFVQCNESISTWDQVLGKCDTAIFFGWNQTFVSIRALCLFVIRTASEASASLWFFTRTKFRRLILSQALVKGKYGCAGLSPILLTLVCIFPNLLLPNLICEKGIHTVSSVF